MAFDCCCVSSSQRTFPCGPNLRLLKGILYFALATVLSKSVAARSPSHDSGARRAFSPDTQGFSAPPLPGPLAGLERLATRGSCINKPGHPLCRRPGSTTGVGGDRGRLPIPASAERDGKHRRAARTLSARRPRGSAAAAAAAAAAGFEVVHENVAWQSKYGGLAVFERLVEMPSGGGGSTGGDPAAPGGGGGLAEPAAGRLVEWHVTGSPLGNFSSVVVFPYDTRTQSCTLIREYCPGANAILSGLPGGMFEPRKHASLLHAARDELNEEAELTGGTWVELAPAGIPQDKYSRNRLHAYLAIDCSVDPSPKPRDDEEHITVEHGVHLDEVMRRIASGDMVAPGAVAALLAVEKLRQMGLR